jgi:hypothetical protein
MNHAARILIAIGAIVAAWTLTHPRQGSRDRPLLAQQEGDFAARTPTSAPFAEHRREKPGGSSPNIHSDFHGLAIQLHGTANELPRFKRMIDEIADLGANSVLLVTHLWQTHAGTADLRFDDTRSPTLADVGQLCAYARGRGLRTVLMPVVLLTNPRNTEWRGRINPNPGWDLWFERYTEFLVRHATIADQYGVDLLMIGSELIKAEKHTDPWRRLIAEVRRHYSGPLGYSANWDHYSTAKIGFWSDLDYVGMTSYYTLAAGPRPSLDEVMSRWEAPKQRILKFHDEVRLPIIFTEVGWCSQEGAASEPWNYYHNPKPTPEALREQATCYEAFMNTWRDVPFVTGTLWWEWSDGPGGPTDTGYTPKGKPAEKLLRAWFADRLQPAEHPPNSP